MKYPKLEGEEFNYDYILNEAITHRAIGNTGALAAGGKYLYNKMFNRDANKGKTLGSTMRNARYVGLLSAHKNTILSLANKASAYIASVENNRALDDEMTQFKAQVEEIKKFLNEWDPTVEQPEEAPTGEADEREKGGEDSKPEEDGKKEPSSGEKEGWLPPDDSFGPDAFREYQRGWSHGIGGQTPEPPEDKQLAYWYNKGYNDAKNRKPIVPEKPKQQPPPIDWSRYRQQRAVRYSHGWKNDGKYVQNRSLTAGDPPPPLQKAEESLNYLGSLCNMISISESAKEAKTKEDDATGGLTDEQQQTIAKAFAKLGELAESGPENQEFVYGIIQQMASNPPVPMSEILRQLYDRAQQEQQAGQVQESYEQYLEEAFGWISRNLAAREAKKAAQSRGQDGDQAYLKAYNNRTDEFKKELDKALYELTMDMKAFGYKNRSQQLDRIINDFRSTLAKYTASGKAEGQGTRLQKLRHFGGRMLSNLAVYGALRAMFPATILGNKYVARGIYGAATSIIRDVSKEQLNKKSILRALAGAGIAVGATIAGEMINPTLATQNVKFDNGYGQGVYRNTTTAGNLGTKIRSWFDSDLRDKFGVERGRYNLYSGDIDSLADAEGTADPDADFHPWKDHSDRITRDFIGTRARVAGLGHDPNHARDVAMGYAAGESTGSINAGHFVSEIAKSDKHLANWFSQHPKEFLKLAQACEDSGFDPDPATFANAVRLQGSVDAAIEYVKSI